MSYVKTAAYDHDLPETCNDDEHAQGCPCAAGGDVVRLSMLRCSECDDFLDEFGCCAMHGQLDFDREGDPAWNGAFSRW